MKLNQAILKEMIYEVLNEDNGSTPGNANGGARLSTGGTSPSQFKAAGIETAGTAATDKEIDRVELTYIKEIQTFLLQLAGDTDLKKYKTQIQTLMKKLENITKPTGDVQGDSP